jgi:hypothetical protein
MTPSVVLSDDSRDNPSLLETTRTGAQLAFAVVLLLSAGCSTGPRPGVTCTLAVIVRGDDGTIALQGPVARLESATVNTVKEISHEGKSLSLLVRKTEYGKATFDLVFSEQETLQVRIKVGETKDILPEGEQVGLRIEVQDCH